MARARHGVSRVVRILIGRHQGFDGRHPGTRRVLDGGVGHIGVVLDDLHITVEGGIGRQGRVAVQSNEPPIGRVPGHGFVPFGRRSPPSQEPGPQVRAAW
jgi:hypothetical protein